MGRAKLVKLELIQSRIYTIRGMQVMVDSDLAELYSVDTKRLNEQVRRNIERFPEGFMFQLTLEEYEVLRSQNATSKDGILKSQIVTSKTSKGGRRYLPYVFTEQGVAMLSAVLKSKTAIKVSIQIMQAFVTMRKIIASHAQVLPRLETVEKRQTQYQVETDKNFEKVFKAIEDKDIHPKQGIFFDGQVFDAYKFTADLIRKAKKSIILIDNYVDDSVLTLFTKRKKSVSVKIFTKTISKQLALDLQRHNAQYPEIIIKEFKDSHDRFLILDNNDVYHFGASLKDLGKKMFAFSKFDKQALQLIAKLRKVKIDGTK